MNLASNNSFRLVDFHIHYHTSRTVKLVLRRLALVVVQ